MSTKKTVLLTLGRLPVALDIARAFYNAGWRVIVADPWRMHLARLSTAVSDCWQTGSPQADPEAYTRELDDIARREDAELIVPVSEESIYVAAMDTAERKRFGMPQEHLLRLHDKFAFVRMAAALGLPVPNTALASDKPDFVDRQAFVSKPRYSCSGRGVTRHEAGDRPPANEGLILQELIHGDELSTFCIAQDGRLVAFVLYRGTLMDGSVSVAFERVEDDGAVRDWVARFVEATRHTGFISFDFIMDTDGVVNAIECNPRTSSGIHFLEPEALLAAVLGDDAPARVYRPGRHRMETYSCFTALLKNLFRPAARRRALQAMRHAKDIVWARDDRRPFLLMMLASWKIVYRAMTSSHSFASAAVADVEWKASSRQ